METLTPARRRTLALCAVLLLLVVLVVRRTGGGSNSTRGVDAHPVLAAGAPAGGGSKVVVHVVGAVHRAGLYRLRNGARIADAVERAGGATRKADLESINLAATVEDGMQVVVPRRVPAAQVAAAPAAPGAAPAAGAKVHLNTATLEQLDSLPGVGPVTAQKILDYRQQHGAFTSIDDLDAISGIGPKRLDQLRDVAEP
jgi:competence protein ComEA